MKVFDSQYGQVSGKYSFKKDDSLESVIDLCLSLYLLSQVSVINASKEVIVSNSIIKNQFLNKNNNNNNNNKETKKLLNTTNQNQIKNETPSKNNNNNNNYNSEYSKDTSKKKIFIMSFN